MTAFEISASDQAGTATAGPLVTFAWTRFVCLSLSMMLAPKDQRRDAQQENDDNGAHRYSPHGVPRRLRRFLLVVVQEREPDYRATDARASNSGKNNCHRRNGGLNGNSQQLITLGETLPGVLTSRVHGGSIAHAPLAPPALSSVPPSQSDPAGRVPSGSETPSSFEPITAALTNMQILAATTALRFYRS